MKRVVTVMLPALLGLAALGSATAVTLADAGDGNDAGIAVWGEAVEVRMSNVDYRADLTRAYAECDTPNTIASDGGPACVPAVSSMCTFDRGRVRLGVGTRSRRRRRGWWRPSRTSGPEPVRRRPLHPASRAARHRRRSGMRHRSLHIPGHHTDRGARAVRLVTLRLRGGCRARRRGGRRPRRSNYEVLGATITGPDDLPLATAGGGYGRHFTNLITNLSAGYPGCTAPDTAGALGAACSAPRWLDATSIADGSLTGEPTKCRFARPSSTSRGRRQRARKAHTSSRHGPNHARRLFRRAVTRPDRILVIRLQPRGGDIEDIEIPVLDGDRTSEESSIEVRTCVSSIRSAACSRRPPSRVPYGSTIPRSPSRSTIRRTRAMIS